MNLQPLRDTVTQADRYVLSAIEHADTADRVVELYDLLTAVAAKAREWKRLMEQRFIEHIEQHGEVQNGTTRYYIGKSKRVKALNKAALLDWLLDLTGGDVVKIAELLASDPVKHGAVRSLAGELGREAEFDRHFETTVEQDLATGKPRKTLAVADDRYLAKGV